MDLTILDVLDLDGIKILLSSKVQYSSLIKCYHSISKTKLDLILRHQTTFLDLLVEACSHNWSFFDDSKITPTLLRERLNDALVQKITVGLMAIGNIFISKISSELLRMGNCFVSDDLIRHVCTTNTQKFSVKQSGNHFLVQITIPSSEEKQVIPSKKYQSRADTQLKHLYKTSPGVVRGLQPSPTLKNILSSYRYWDEFCRSSSTSIFVDWLLNTALHTCPNNLEKYKDDLHHIFAEILQKYLKSCARSIQQLTDHLCLDRPQFISQERVIDVLKSDTNMAVSKETRHLPICERKVCLLRHENEFLNDLDDDFLLPERLDCRIVPLLTLRITWDAILSVFKIVGRTRKMQSLLHKYGCFINYLIDLAEATKPKLSTNEFREHLYSLVKSLLLKFVDARSSQGEPILQLLKKIAPVGFLDSNFLHRTAQYYSNEFCVSDERIIYRNNTVEKESVVEEKNKYRSPSGGRDPLADLESPRVLHLLSKQPRFIDISDVFMSLPEIALSVLTNSSMSFFEWLITLSKRLMPHDAPIFELHLQNMICGEVVRIHSQQHCQMTIHHVHSQLCSRNHMLLSPNFLSWCLEQPDSAFTVHQSWIYLKNSIRRKSSDASTSKNEFSMKKRTILESLPDILLSTISTCLDISELTQIIKTVPLEQVGSIIQTSNYWYDFMENNAKERIFRQKLANLLAEEAKKGLGKRILCLSELLIIVSKGVPNFVSAETLEYVLRQHMATFAISGTANTDCRVGVVREMEEDVVKCADDNEENLMRQLLMYFPWSGSCEVSTLLGLLTKEHSFLYRDSNPSDVDYLRCFLLVFPMLFYLSEDVVVLTCMALDRRGEYKAALYPTSTTDAFEDGEVKKRNTSSRKRMRLRHHSKRNKRRRSSGRRASSIYGEDCGTKSVSKVIVINDDSSADLPDESQTGLDNEDYLIVDEDIKNDSLNDVIDDLPAVLIIDVAGSLLMNNNGHARPDPLLRELLSMTVGADEYQQIGASEELFYKFKGRVLEVLNRSCKFNVVYKIIGNIDSVSEVIINTNEGLGTRDVGKKGGKFRDVALENGIVSQVEEVTSSTSSTPSYICNEDQITEDTFKSYAEESAGKTQSTSSHTFEHNVDEIIKLPSVTYTPMYTEQTDEYLCKTLSGDGTTEHTSKTTTEPNVIYSSTPACSSYVKEKSTRGQPRAPKSSRDEKFMEFFRSYLKINLDVCSTELLIASAYRRFQDERFARSRLAFEAYIYDFVVQNFACFVFSGAGCEFGVSKIFRRRISPNSSPQSDGPPNLFFLKFIPAVCASCCAFLNSRPDEQSELIDVCEAINAEFSDQIGIFSDEEVAAVVRCLVLVTVIRNLKLFCFAVDEPSLYLRNHKVPKVKASIIRHEHKSDIENILQNSKVKDSVILMADILRTRRPTSQTVLRNIWQTQAPAPLAKVFGTGVSFTLSLRKYAFLFPPASDGSITVDETALKYIERA